MWRTGRHLHARFQLGTARFDELPRVVVGWNGRCAELSALLGNAAPTSMLELIEEWPGLREELENSLADFTGDAIEPTRLRWLPPVMPRKLICVGANYGSHHAEMRGGKGLEYPYTFLKPPSTTLHGSGQPVGLPRHASKIDYEAELAVVMGSANEIFGYTILNDLSARDWIPAPSPLGFDWIMLKAFDGSAPMGPWITPAEFVRDPQRLAIRLTLNGETRQDANTAEMLFSVSRIVEHLASVMTLEPGDVIATGTPEGVGFGRKPPEFLKPGDRIRVEIEGLGALETPIA